MSPLLHYHQVSSSRIFNLTKATLGISIRDQMVRARWLGAILPEWLRDPDRRHLINRPIVILGSGACGVTIALTLAASGFQTVLVDKNPGPFSLQSKCDTRWLDPTVNDWPMDHWAAGRFPWPSASKCDFPLPWQANWSHEVAKSWHVAFASHKQRLRAKQLVIYRKARLAKEPDEGLDGSVNVTVKLSSGLKRVIACQALIRATGFPEERTSVDGSPHFHGFRFWDSDSFERRYSGLASRNDEGTVVISGTGDGALSDLLRVLTRKRSTRHIMDALGLTHIAPEILRDVYSHEHKMERALAWTDERRFLEPYWLELHNAHDRAAKDLLGDPHLVQRIHRLCANRPLKTIVLSLTPYFNGTYGITRFLAHLITRALGKNIADIRLGYEVLSITSQSGIPTSNAQDCLGVPWDVQIRSVQDPSQAESISSNVVIVRHGLTAAGSQTMASPRPFPPTHLY